MSTAVSVGADAPLEENFLTAVLTDLVETNSVNPGVYEPTMAEHVAAWLGGTPAEVTTIEFAPGRPSLAATIGSGDSPRLVVNGHMDTVPVDNPDNWTSGPFSGQIRQGYLYGRGACDMKAGLAAQIGLAHYLRDTADRLQGTLILHFAAGEECGEPGTLSLLNAGFSGDYGIVTEPTELKVAAAARGLCHYRIRLSGRSIHASRARLGVNPVPPLADVLDIVSRYDEDVRKRTHPLLHSGSSTPTVVRAGVKANAVADTCDLIVDRRLLPGETVDGELAELEARLGLVRERFPDVGLTVDYLDFPYASAETDNGSSIASRVAAAAAAAADDVTGRPTDLWGTPFASDVRNLINDAGMDAVTFGPGNVAECHCANERVALSQVSGAARVLARVAGDLLF